MDFSCSLGMNRVTIGAHAMSIRRVLLTVAALLTLSSTAARAEPVALTAPVAKPLAKGQGTGLCVTSAISPLISTFDVDKIQYTNTINTFIETAATGPQKLPPDQDKPYGKATSVMRNLFDLSNNNTLSGKTLSYGDFLQENGQCQAIGGCGFFLNDSDTHFGSRIRGFLNVTAELAGKPIHIGFYADDAVSLTFYDGNLTPKEVLVQAPVLGSATWRTTNTVTFPTEGLYPLEILYVEINEHAALEMSWRVDTMFSDIEKPVSQIDSPNLNDPKAPFTLFTQGDFYETLSGQPPYETELFRCAQCNRNFINQPDKVNCGDSYYCNEAALCAPCDSDRYCGPSCSPCGGLTPFCINVNSGYECANCRTNDDCGGFFCDPITHQCQDCRNDDDCERGKTCEDHVCVACSAADKCAGTSCNCCPKGTDGTQLRCAALEKDGTPLCVECVDNKECKTGVCDKVIGRCVEALKKNSTPQSCGDSGFNCAQDNLDYCLPGPIGTACAQCRSDMDCDKDKAKGEEGGEYCLSGECTACVVDRRCGQRCISCGGETPFCLGERAVDDTTTCVRCEKDEQCIGGKCNPETHQCDVSCAMTCAPEKPFCNGRKCVECYADTQCPCGGTCDLDTNTCSPSCKTNGDCLGNEHCRWKNETQKDCVSGPMQPVECSTGLDMVIGQATNALESEESPEFCGFDSSSGSCATSGHERKGELPSAGLLGLISMALLALRRGRGKS
jgi:outer membrane exchange protein TraA